HVTVRPNDFYRVRLGPATGKTLLIDKRFGVASDDQVDPRYPASIARNTRPGDLILSFPQKMRLPFAQILGESMRFSTVDNYAGHRQSPQFILFLRTEEDNP